MMVMLSAMPTRFQPIHFSNCRATARSGLSISFPDGRFLALDLGRAHGQVTAAATPSRTQAAASRAAPNCGCVEPTREAAGEMLALLGRSGGAEPRMGTRSSSECLSHRHDR